MVYVVYSLNGTSSLRGQDSLRIDFNLGKLGKVKNESIGVMSVSD